MKVINMEVEFEPGDIVYFYPESLTMCIVMSNDEGVRYMTPGEPITDEDGKVLTFFVSREVLMENCMLLGSITDLVSDILLEP